MPFLNQEACTDPTQATARLIVVPVSRIQKNSATDNNFVKWKGKFGPTDRNDQTGQSGPLQRWTQILRSDRTEMVRSIWFLTEISGSLGLMASSPNKLWLSVLSFSLQAPALTCISVNHKNCPPWNLEMRGSELIFIVIINELSWIPVCSCKEIESHSNPRWALRQLYQYVWLTFKATILSITDLLREKKC